MRTSCHVALEAVSARLDGELSAPDSIMLDEHLQECADCRDAERDLTTALSTRGGIFRRVISTAPHARWEVSPIRELSHPARSRRWLLAATWAAAVILCFALLPFPGTHVHEAAAQVLLRASRDWLALRDAEMALHIETTLPLRRQPIETADLRVNVDRAGRLLLMDESKSYGPFPYAAGFDGEHRWRYDPNRGVVQRLSPDEPLILQRPGLSLEVGGDIERMVRYLTRRLVRDILNASRSGTLVMETRNALGSTGPEREYSFALPTEEDSPLAATTRVTVRIGTEGSLQCLSVETVAAQLITVRIALRTVRVNAGLDRSFFASESHSPAGTPVIESRK